MSKVPQTSAERASEDDRAAILDGLTQVVEYLRATPDLPIDAHTARMAFHLDYAERCSHESNMATLAKLAAIMGVEITRSVGGHLRARRNFGPVEYEVLYIPASVMAQYRDQQSYIDNVQTAPAPAAPLSVAHALVDSYRLHPDAESEVFARGEYDPVAKRCGCGHDAAIHDEHGNCLSIAGCECGVGPWYLDDPAPGTLTEPIGEVAPEPEGCEAIITDGVFGRIQCGYPVAEGLPFCPRHVTNSPRYAATITLPGASPDRYRLTDHAVRLLTAAGIPLANMHGKTANALGIVLNLAAKRVRSDPHTYAGKADLDLIAAGRAVMEWDGCSGWLAQYPTTDVAVTL